MTATMTKEPITDDTRFVPTEAGLDALQESGDVILPPAATAETSEAEATPERFVIDNAGKANWYLRRLRQLDDEIATVKEQAAQIVRSLESDRNRLCARHEADFLAWAKDELTERGGGKKTLTLFQGTVAFRTVPSSLRVLGSGEAIEHAKAQGWEVVKTVETLDGEAYKREAAAVLAQTGEVLPGIEVVAARESFSIKFGKAKGGTQEGGEAE